MSLTKSERAELAHWQTRAALTWPGYEKPKPMSVPENGVAVGWWTNSYSKVVTQGWFSAHAHYKEGKYEPDPMKRYTASQGSGTFYATKRDAYKAMRHELSERFAKELAEIDGLIREEETK